MIDIKEKYMCDGCHACYSVCPKDAINMEIDDEGFWYPKVDNDKCVDCNKCEKVCPILNKKEVKSLKKAYACYNLDEDIRMKSSSGGIFTILASEKLATAVASFLNLSDISLLLANSFFNIFTATNLLSLLSLAL